MNRIRFESHLHGHEGLPLIVWNTVIENGKRSCIANLHENIEILYFYDGEGFVTLDATVHPVSRGDFVVANANVAHHIETDGQLSYLCLIVFRSYAAASGLDTNLIRFAPAFRDEDLAASMFRLQKEYENTEGEYRATALRALSLEILLHLARHHRERAEARPTKGISDAISYIKTHYAEPITVEDVAHHVGYSLSYLSHEFRARTGSTVIRYLNLVRCEFSKSLLQDPSIPISAVAERCGYRNDSYFTRTFRKFNRITPSEYRRMAVSAAKEEK